MSVLVVGWESKSVCHASDLAAGGVCVMGNLQEQNMYKRNLEERCWPERLRTISIEVGGTECSVKREPARKKGENLQTLPASPLFGTRRRGRRE